jgi:hypothetical protein
LWPGLVEVSLGIKVDATPGRLNQVSALVDYNMYKLLNIVE